MLITINWPIVLMCGRLILKIFQSAQNAKRKPAPLIAAIVKNAAPICGPFISTAARISNELNNFRRLFPIFRWGIFYDRGRKGFSVT